MRKIVLTILLCSALLMCAVISHAAITPEQAIQEVLDLTKRPLVYRELMDKTWLVEYDRCIDKAQRMAKSDVRNEKQYLEDCKELYDKLTEMQENPGYARGDCPRIYLQTVENLNTTDYLDAVVIAVDKEDGAFETVVSGITARIRGNSTAKPAKKPYNIKFEKKISLFGMEKGKKWCLLADYYDKSLLRNKIAYEFAELVELPNAIDSRTVELWFNGEYQGVYLLTEPVSDGRLDLDIEAYEFLYVFQNGRDGRPSIKTSKSKRDFTVDSAEWDEMTPDQQEMAQLWLNAFDEAAHSKDRNHIEFILHVDSFAKLYLIDELFKNVDVQWNSTYYYVKDELVYAGPLWDRDLSMGNIYETAFEYWNAVDPKTGKVYGDGSGDTVPGLYANRNIWVNALLENEFFVERVKELYVEWIPYIEALYADGGTIDGYVDEFGAAFERNYSDTPWDVSFNPDGYGVRHTPDTYQGNVDMLKDWLYRRDMWLRDYYEVDA